MRIVDCRFRIVLVGRIEAASERSDFYAVVVVGTQTQVRRNRHDDQVRAGIHATVKMGQNGPHGILSVEKGVFLTESRLTQHGCGV